MKFKKYSSATDTYTTLPATFQTSGADVVNYQVYGASSGVGEETENLFDYTAQDTDNGFIANKYLNRVGGVNDSSNHNVSEYIEIEPSTVYSLCQSRAQLAVSMCFYNSEKSFISSVVEENAITTVTSPANAKYVRFTILISYQSEIMFVPGSTAPTTFTPFGYKIPILNTSGVTENFYDDETSTVKKILDDLGELSNNRYYKTSDYIDCTGGSKINCYGVSVHDSNRLVRIAFYDNNQAFLSKMDSETFISGNYSFTFTAPQNACYFRVSFIRTDTDVSVTLRYTSNYDLFIDDSKLGEDEYLDFSEQKVYKRTAQLWDWVKRDVPNIGIRYAILVGAGTYTIVNNTTNKMGDTEGNIYNEGTTTTVTYSADTWIYRGSNPTSYNGDITVVSGSTVPAEHLPYYNIIDPPAPFPTLTTYLGESSIDVDTTVQPEKVVLTVAAWREIEVKKYVNGSWTDIVVRRYENGAWVPSPIPENNIANLQGLLTLLEDHWLPGVNDYRSMILVRTNRNDDTANQLCYMLTCYSTNPSPHFASEFLNNRYWLNDYAVPYSSTDFYLRKFSWSQGGGWVYDGDEGNKRDDYFVPIDSNTYNVYLLRLGSSTQYDNNAGYQYFYDLSAYF